MAGPYSIFISYAHEDESFKDQLTQHLAGLKAGGRIAPWDDRCIDGGDDWRHEIERAIEGCDLALLLLSPAFIASDFIRGEELPRLLARRDAEGIRVVPLIVRPCGWRFEEPMQALQARPTDGKAIVTFAEGTGERDQAWLEIVGEMPRLGIAGATGLRARRAAAGRTRGQWPGRETALRPARCR